MEKTKLQTYLIGKKKLEGKLKQIEENISKEISRELSMRLISEFANLGFDVTWKDISGRRFIIKHKNGAAITVVITGDTDPMHTSYEFLLSGYQHKVVVGGVEFHLHTDCSAVDVLNQFKILIEAGRRQEKMQALDRIEKIKTEIEIKTEKSLKLTKLLDEITMMHDIHDK